MELQVTAYRLKTLLKSPYEKQSVFLSLYCANRQIKIIIIDVYYGCDSTLQNYIPDAQGTWCQTERDSVPFKTKRQQSFPKPNHLIVGPTLNETSPMSCVYLTKVT